MEWLREREDISLLPLLIERLAIEPMSRHRSSLLATGTESPDAWMGWSVDSSRLADLTDLMDFAARAGAMQKAKFRQVAPRPTPPATRQVIEAKATRVADMDWGAALSALG